MTGGQDRAAAVRRIAPAAVRSDRICEFMGSTATPRLKAGACSHPPGASSRPAFRPRCGPAA